MVSLTVRMLLVRLQIDYIELLKLKAYKPFEISDADLSWLPFYRSQLVKDRNHHLTHFPLVICQGFES